MSNRKKLRGARDGATRTTPDKSMKGTFYGLYKLEVYDKKANAWNTLAGCSNLSWREAVAARTTEGVQGSQQECITNSSTGQ